MTHAILIIAHKYPEMLIPLIEYFKRDCVVYIHYDRNARLTETEATRLRSFPQVKGLYQQFAVHWGGYSILQAELFLLQQAYNDGVAEYYHILSAQDYPIMSFQSFMDFFEEHPKKEDTVFIPLRVELGMNRHPRIDYIVPEWGGRQWGDVMFDVPKVDVNRDKDVLTFVSTFYKRYVYSYATNSSTMDADREQLCKRFCTPALCDSIEQVRVNRRDDDGLDGFDAIINDYDFDALWFTELAFSAIDNHQVLVSFHDYHHLVVTVSGKRGSFLINSISVK